MKFGNHFIGRFTWPISVALAGLGLALACGVYAQDVEILDEELDLLELEDDTPRIRLVPPAEFERVYGDLLDHLSKDYDQRFPVVKKGEDLEIVKPNRIVDTGVYQGNLKGEVQLKKEDSLRKIALNQLRVQDRLRLDPAFRTAWLDVLVRAQTRQHFLGLDMVFKTYDLGLQSQFNEALGVSDKAALYHMAKEYRGGIKREKDFGYCFLYTSAAAKQGVVEARYFLGRMFYSGLATSPNKRVGLQWIASAAKDNHQAAQKFLELHKISHEAVTKAAEARQAALREEQEAYAARLEHYQKVNASRVIIRGKKKESSFE